MNLQEGDVIKLKKGMIVYGKIPEMFVISNRLMSKELTSHEIEVGKVFENITDIKDARNHVIKGIVERFSWEGIKIDRKKVQTFVNQNMKRRKKESFVLNEGLFVVIKTAVEGGGTGHGPHDIYPDGHHVYCKALLRDKYDENGVEVDFYQSGSFTCVIEDIKSIGFLKRQYV